MAFISMTENSKTKPNETASTILPRLLRQSTRKSIVLQRTEDNSLLSSSNDSSFSQNDSSTSQTEMAVDSSPSSNDDSDVYKPPFLMNDDSETRQDSIENSILPNPNNLFNPNNLPNPKNLSDSTNISDSTPTNWSNKSPKVPISSVSPSFIDRDHSDETEKWVVSRVSPSRSDLLRSLLAQEETVLSSKNETQLNQTNSPSHSTLSSETSNLNQPDEVNEFDLSSTSRPQESQEKLETDSIATSELSSKNFIFQEQFPELQRSVHELIDVKKQTVATTLNRTDDLIVVSELSKGYVKGKNLIPVLKNIDLEVKRGEFLSIVGQSGSGKSTLLHLIGTLDVPDSGTIHMDGQRIDNLPTSKRDILRNRYIGMIFQFYHLIPEMTMLENVLAPLMIRESFFGYCRNRRKYIEKAKYLLNLVGLAHRMKHKPNELSGGEMQRSSIARALIASPRVLLADEPTGNLDSKTSIGIMKLLRSLNLEQELTIVMVTHDLPQAENSDRIIRIVDGQIVSS